MENRTGRSLLLVGQAAGQHGGLGPRGQNTSISPGTLIISWALWKVLHHDLEKAVPRIEVVLVIFGWGHFPMCPQVKCSLKEAKWTKALGRNRAAVARGNLVVSELS